MHTLSNFETTPSEVLEEIALALVSFSFLGPPAGILTLLTLSKTVLKKLSPETNPHLYSRIFRLKFDTRAAVRRLGDECNHTDRLSRELIRRCTGLRRIRHQAYPTSIDGLGLEDNLLKLDLWMAYLMFIESDDKNAKQLTQYAHVGRLVSQFMTLGGRFHNGTNEASAWTVDNESMESESPVERRNIFQALAHVYFGSFKYASTYAPITSFNIPPPAPPPIPAPSFALPLASSPIVPPCIIPEHFGFALQLVCPLLTPASLLICVVRLEAAIAEVDAASPFNIPTRADATAVGAQGATRAVEWVQNDLAGSNRHEHDWLRSQTCFNPWSYPVVRDRVFTPGMLAGVWVGRLFGIPSDDFAAMLSPEQLARAPPQFVWPMQFRLQEHHQHNPNSMLDFDDISCGGKGSGVFNAWFPRGTSTVESEGRLHVCVRDESAPLIYRTYNPSTAAQAALDAELPDDEGLYGGGVWDILLTAQTDEDFGRAWGSNRYRGRVRDWDGLIVLVREASATAERWIFRGYVHGKQNLVGRWRETRTPVHLPGWEGVWSMTKVE